MMYANLYQALQAAAQEQPNQQARGVVLVEGSDKENFLSYAELQQQALAMLAHLQALGVQKGDELVFQFVELQSLMVTYWACLAGGIVPIPLEFADQTNAIEKVFSVWSILRQPWLVSDALEKIADKHAKHAASAGASHQARWQKMQERSYAMPSQQELAQLTQPPHLPELDSEDIAFIQFSSGSTGMPKGVTMTHKNLLTNIGDILAAVHYQAGQTFVTWKPITHDFGMIAFHLAPIVAKANQVRINTDAFIWNPSLWFAMVDKYRAAILGSPNFGYRHFLKLFRRGRGKKPDWDLSCVTVILNGAEPISQALCDEFTSELAAFGLPKNVMTPGYGLAEGSLIASLCPIEEAEIASINVDRRYLAIGDTLQTLPANAPHAVNFVDCGFPYPNTQIRISTDTGQVLGEGQVGLIEIRGDSVTKGYYLNNEANRSLISQDGWLNTQDLGVFLHGRLYVVGRMKEMIIVGGVNFFPHDIEQAILRAKGDQELNKYIACAVNDPANGEQLLLFVYHKKSDGEFAPLAAQLRLIIEDSFGIAPLHVIAVNKIPKTTSGKVQRFHLVQDFLDGKFDAALLALGEARQIASTSPAVASSGEADDLKTALQTALQTEQQPAEAEPLIHPAEAEIIQRTAAIAAKLLAQAQVDPDASFFDLGFTSLRLLNLRTALEDAFDVSLDATSALDFPTVRSLAQYIARTLKQRTGDTANTTSASAASSVANGHDDIAIVGMACRFPGVDGSLSSPQAYWQLLRDGLDPVREVPRDRWQHDLQQEQPLATKQGGFLSQIDQFDPLFFGISPAECVAMDPQQRLLLEVSHEAIENAGWHAQALAGSRCAVYIGISANEYASLGRDLGYGTGPYTFTGNMFNSAAGRVSYTFGLQGASVAVDTACSSSLVAVAQGMRELRAGTCDAVLAGGVSMILKTDGHISFSRLHALSETGRCRSFDDSADGYIRGEGCGIVILKRLSDAIKDGDRVLAVLKGQAINHNGRSGGLTVPSGPAQQRLIEQALQDADVSAEQIDYVEAHGSGTRLGDPQELNALAQVFAARAKTARPPVQIGSVKSNLGHLESAAGIAGLIKLVLMLRHESFVGNLHYKIGNRLTDWDKVPVQVATRYQAWPAPEAGQPRMAGISSFGISGTNAHLILQQYVAAPDDSTSLSSTPQIKLERNSHIFSLSAKSAAALRSSVQEFAAFTAGHANELSFAELCRASNLCRSQYPYRVAFASTDYAHLQKRLAKLAQDTQLGQTSGKPATGNAAPIVFMFTGQGSIYPTIGLTLYQQAPAFAQAFDTCDSLFQAALGFSLRQRLYEQAENSAEKGITEDAISAQLREPQLSQALIFSLEYALCRLWQAYGVRPDIVLGHSIGEYVAACEAGIISLQQAVQMVALRGSIMQETAPDGAMLGVLSNAASVTELLQAHPQVHIAAINTSENVTVSGPNEAVAVFAAAARKARMFTETLPLQHAFHSPWMQASASRLAQGMQAMQFATPQRCFISSQTGQQISSGEQIAQAYWSEHLCKPVLFAQAMQTALDMGAQVFVEIGGTAALSGLGAQICNADQLQFLPTMRQAFDCWTQINQTIASLYQAHVPIDWEQYHAGNIGHTALDLPNTSYQRNRYWFEPLATNIATNKENIPLAHGSAATQVQVREQIQLPAQTELTAQVQFDQSYICSDIGDMVSQVTGVEAEEIGADAHLFSLGMDSLMLTQLDKRLVKRYGVEIPVKLFFAELNTPRKIAGYIWQNIAEPAKRSMMQSLQPSLPPSSAAIAPAALAQDITMANNCAASATEAGSGLQAIIARQLELMGEQLALLRGQPSASAPALNPTTAQTSAQTSKAAANKLQNKLPSSAPSGKNALRDMTLHEEDVNPQQRQFIGQLAEKIVAKTPKSRAYAQRYRTVLADWIATLNFSLTTKEMAYPIVSSRSRGAYFWDIDGNRFLDTACGYGATFFGHNPEFIVDAIREQLDLGFELGPQSGIAGEVAQLISQLTGVERVAFCNSGTEAVMVAVRLARTVTRRKKFVRFINSYHGSFDGVLAEAGEDGAVPMAPGIIESMVEDTIVLHYGTPASLAAIRAVGEDLAAVLVEPVQSRNPENYSQAYLQQLRDITTEMGAALIFDEMITGFRIAPGGVQSHFNLRADLVTYGKIVGGGMPIGVVAGTALYMDAIDGGSWQFGDQSGPARETTFFAGTFCKHPLAMAAARAVLTKLAQDGVALMQTVNQLTQDFVAQANAFFAAEEIPIRALRFGSLYRFDTLLSTDPARSSLEMNLLFKHMLLDEVFYWERRTAFFSLAHTSQDAEHIMYALQRACHALRAGGFQFRRAQVGGGSVAVPAKAPNLSASVMDGSALSSEERRMYVLSLMKGGENAYHVTGALRVQGALDAARLRRALEALAERHPILRTGYVFQQGSIVHRSLAQVALPLHHMKLEAGASLDQVLAQQIQAFDLAKAPLWRAVCIETGTGTGTGTDEHILLLDFHHLIADGISMSILIEDLWALYQANGQQTSGAALPALAAVPANYADFVQWEQAFVVSEDYRQQAAYWQQQLTPFAPLLELPCDAVRPPQNDFAGENLRFTLGQEAHQGVRALAKQYKATPFMVLLSSYFIFLQKLTQQDDICIGTPYDRRRHGNFERTVGMFAQTLIIRAKPDSQQSFVSMLEQVRLACSGAYGNADVSVDALVQQLAVPRDFSRNALFDTMFIYENGNRRLYDNEQLHISTVPVALRSSAFDLTLEMTEEQGQFHCALIYASRLFSASRAQRWATYFAHLLQQIIARPEAKLAQYEIVDTAERQQMLLAFNASEREYDLSTNLHSLLHASSTQFAQRSALVFGEESWSYGQLHQHSHTLALHLLQAGVKPGDLVGVLLPRGTALIASLLAVLKVGAAYVPLDPQYPAARLAYMVQESGMQCMFGLPELAGELGFAGELLEPAALLAQAASQGPAEQPMPSFDANALAYVIFTSGSTGKPKGVMLEHRSVVNFLHAMDEALQLPDAAKVLGLTTISFDIFVLEVFLSLYKGACLVLADEQQQRDPKALLALIARHQVNVMQVTPSRMQMLLATHSPAQALAGLHTVLLGGEALPDALLKQLQSGPEVRLFNVYGPTETTVWSACKDLNKVSRVTLGGPIANTRFYVLDAQHALRPLGSIGDLYIAGAGLARGYWRDKSRTHAAFAPDPFVPGERMYRTGDCAAWSEDGDLHYHGRSDNQIKLRGYRIELGEIENVLQQHPALIQAAVIVHEISAGNPVLLAFYVAKADAGEQLLTQLRQHATQYLPDYMRPGIWQAIETLPSTPNGKVDRLRLARIANEQLEATKVAQMAQMAQMADPAQNSTRHAQAEQALAGEEEKVADALTADILAVWRSILGLRAIGMKDSFFDVGGNSFSLVAMHGVLDEKYPGTLEVADIFANPTIAALKQQIENKLASKQSLPQLLFPQEFFSASSAGNAQLSSGASLEAHLDDATGAQLLAQATSLNLNAAEFAFALYLFYLGKLLKLSQLEQAASLSPRAEYQLMEIDLRQVRNIADLAAQVREQLLAEPWGARRLVSHTAASAHREKHTIRCLFANATALGQTTHQAERYGFDLVLKIRQQGDGLHFMLDYDSVLLDGEQLKLFLNNYLKIIKALLASGQKNSQAKTSNAD